MATRPIRETGVAATNAGLYSPLRSDPSTISVIFISADTQQQPHPEGGSHWHYHHRGRHRNPTLLGGWWHGHRRLLQFSFRCGTRPRFRTCTLWTTGNNVIRKVAALVDNPFLSLTAVSWQRRRQLLSRHHQPLWQRHQPGRHPYRRLPQHRSHPARHPQLLRQCAGNPHLHQPRHRQRLPDPIS